MNEGSQSETYVIEFPPLEISKRLNAQFMEVLEGFVSSNCKEGWAVEQAVVSLTLCNSFKGAYFSDVHSARSAFRETAYTVKDSAVLHGTKTCSSKYCLILKKSEAGVKERFVLRSYFPLNFLVGDYVD